MRLIGGHDDQGDLPRLTGKPVRLLLQGQDRRDVPLQIGAGGHKSQGDGQFNAIVAQPFPQAAGDKDKRQTISREQSLLLELKERLIHLSQLDPIRNLGCLAFKGILSPG